MYNPYDWQRFNPYPNIPPVYNSYSMNGIYSYRPQFPEVDPTLFNESAIEMQKLLKDASVILDRLAQSKSFAQKVMSAAQESQQKEVERLIESTGVKSKVKTTFNPDGIHLLLSSSVEAGECCKLSILLRWK
ncbi:hypothetical protein RZN22_16585 [Bacillaceae bacterium S4-13-58]